MKTFIALTFIGILTYAYADIGSLSECKKPTPMDRFSATKFHSGTWFVTHVTNVTEPTECRTLTTSKVGSNYIVEHDFTKGGIQGRLHCEAPREKEKRLTFTCTFNGESIDKTIFIVMDTDYNDYALYYICSAITGANADRKPGDTVDNYLVARRTSGNTKIPDKLKSLTEGMEFKKCT